MVAARLPSAFQQPLAGWRAGGLAALLSLSGMAHAQAQDFDPGSIASVPEDTPADSAVGLRVELWRQQFGWRSRPAGETDEAWRGVLDFRREWTISPQWRLGLSNRFEAVYNAGDKPDTERNALREAFASWDAGDGWHLDAGRINSRQGMASGYNPSDFLRAYAVIVRPSQDPAALRENRLGTVMLRAQKLGTWGAAQLTLVPQLSSRDTFSTTRWGAGLERTNRREAVLLRFAPQVGDRLALDAGVYTRAGDAPQWAANLSFVAADALLLHAEWAGGRMTALPAPGEATGTRRWSNRIATGANWTLPWRMTLTVEHLFAGQALGRADWRAWRDERQPAARARLGALRGEVQERQELLARRAWFARMAWEQAFDVRHLDLSAFVRMNAYDHSRTLQLDAAWHVTDTTSLRLIAGRSAGRENGEFASAQRRSLALYLQSYF